MVTFAKFLVASVARLVYFMSFVYYSVLSTEGLPLIAAQASLTASWSTPERLTALITYLTSIDFAEYQNRRHALAALRSVVIPQFAYTYPFDPLAYPLVPPATQVRFPGAGTYTYLPPTINGLLADLASALAYRDSDGPITDPEALFTASLIALVAAAASPINQFDRLAWEVEHVLIWAIYPPIPPPI